MANEQRTATLAISQKRVSTSLSLPPHLVDRACGVNSADQEPGPKSPAHNAPAAFHASNEDRLHARDLFRFSPTRTAALV